MHKKKKLVVILGPTAVGKTVFSIALANHFRTEIISADSRQIFRELNIGVARPSELELSLATHHLIGFFSIQDAFSAGDYERRALSLLENLFEKHDVVICSGGSMMYVDALLYGLDELPSSKELKSLLKTKFDTEGLAALVSELNTLDPEYAVQVDLNNPHRVIRALEVCRLTGKKYSELRKSSHQIRDFEIIKIGLTGSKKWLYDRINQRVDTMMQSGFIVEAKSVHAHKHLNALQTVGYKELFDYFDNVRSLEEAIDKIKQHTRNFAKRQMTWWRRDEEIHWIDVEENSATALEQVVELLGKR